MLQVLPWCLVNASSCTALAESQYPGQHLIMGLGSALAWDYCVVHSDVDVTRAGCRCMAVWGLGGLSFVGGMCAVRGSSLVRLCVVLRHQCLISSAQALQPNSHALKLGIAATVIDMLLQITRATCTQNPTDDPQGAWCVILPGSCTRGIPAGPPNAAHQGWDYCEDSSNNSNNTTQPRPAAQNASQLFEDARQAGVANRAGGDSSLGQPQQAAADNTTSSGGGVTLAGCQCAPTWVHEDQLLQGVCANPDRDPGTCQWCLLYTLWHVQAVWGVQLPRVAFRACFTKRG
jgi:hypothetical protein